MSARRDPVLKQFAAGGAVRIAACYPRAVKWLFAAADAPLMPEAQVVNLRVETVEAACAGLLPPVGCPDAASSSIQTSANGRSGEVSIGHSAAPGWKPWFPVIDYDRCTHCMQCLSFCLFGVYGVDAESRIQVQNREQCKTNCPACSRVCPEAAIVFPKHGSGPINGDAVSEADVTRSAMKIDISALLGGDVYSLLRQRGNESQPRFSKERDPETALRERQRCLALLAGEIPPEVLRSLPAPEELARRAAEAQARAQNRSSLPKPADSPARSTP